MRNASAKILRSLTAPLNPKEAVRIIQILIPSFPALQSKLSVFPKQFEIITDFDFTITKYKHLDHSVSTMKLVSVL